MSSIFYISRVNGIRTATMLICFFSATCVHAGINLPFRRARDYNMQIHGGIVERTAMRSLLLNINAAVDRYLGMPENPRQMPTVNIYAVMSKPLSSNMGEDEPFVVYVTPHDPYLNTLVRLIRVVISQRMTAMMPSITRTSPLPPEWLVAAVSAQFLRPSFNSSAQLTTRVLLPVRIALDMHEGPSIEAMVTRPVSTKFEAPYTLYTLHCYILAEVIRELDRNKQNEIMKRIIVFKLDGRDDYLALRMTIGPLLDSYTTLQQWYVNAAKDYIDRRRPKITGAQLAREISAILTVDVADVPPGDLAVMTQRVPLVAIPPSAQFWLVSKPVFNQRISELIRLQQRAPTQFVEPVSMYLGAFLSFVKTGDVPVFKKALLDLDSKFSATMQRHHEIAECLVFFARLTESSIPKPDSFAAIVAARRLNITQMNPRLAEYLDMMEKQLQ